MLRIRVTYDDVAQPAESFLPILVRHLSWDSDIQPIIADRCNGCHGATGAVALKLSNHTDWVTHIEAVVTAVETGLMPPGTPLERDHIDTIHYWRLAGFPE